MTKALIIILFLLWATPGWCAFSFYRTITVAHGQVSSSSQTQFPILVCGNGSGVCNASVSGLNQTGAGAHVQNSNGYDVIFTTDQACTNKLTWEMETYNASTGEFEAWVTNTSTALSNTVDTVFYMCYGNAAISTFQSTASSVWDSSFVGVFHFPNGTTLGVNDSTTNAANGVSTGTPSATAGQIDGGVNIPAVSGPNYVKTGVTNTLGNFTACSWFKHTAGNGFSRILDKNFSTGFWLGMNNMTTTSWGGGILQTTGGFGIYITLTDNAWHYLCQERSGTTQTVTGDGSTTVTQAVVTTALSSTNLTTGYDIGDASGQFGGIIDEIRVSNTARSAGWIQTEYNNMSSPSTFYTLGSETASAHTNLIQGVSLIRGVSLIN